MRQMQIKHSGDAECDKQVIQDVHTVTKPNNINGNSVWGELQREMDVHVYVRTYGHAG